MKPHIASFLIATTAMIPLANAQDNAPQPTEAQCQELVAYVTENDTTETGMDRQRAFTIAERDDPDTCNDALRMSRGEISAREGEDNYDADAMARIRVIVPDPEVTVQQASPEVQVEQPQPMVSVSPGQPIVTVNQAEPVVRVQLSPPKITIDMPKPQILVEVPDPTVEVSMAQPRVTVTQAQPTVTVEQGEVQMQVGESQVASDSGGEANVTVEQKDADVQVTQAQEADIQVAEVRPQVRYNAAEPNIQVEQAGEAEVSFNQSGEADVQFRQMTADETRDASEQQMAAANTEAEPLADAELNRRLSVVEPEPAEEGAERTAGQALSVADILDMTVIGADGGTIGDVEEVFMRGETAFVVVGNGGFLGLGEKEIALPLSDMVVRENELVMRNVTEEEVSGMQEFNEADFTAADTNQQVDIRTE